MLRTLSLFFLNQRKECRIWPDSAEYAYDFWNISSKLWGDCLSGYKRARARLLEPIEVLGIVSKNTLNYSRKYMEFPEKQLIHFTAIF